MEDINDDDDIHSIAYSRLATVSNNGLHPGCFLKNIA
jgi:hypothetical protein